MEKETKWGQTVVHDEVLAVIAARAALSVPGVASTNPRGWGDNLNSLMRHDASPLGVRIISLPEGHYGVEIHLALVFGTRFARVGRQVGQAVNNALQEAEGLYPDKIMVHVDGVRTGE